MNLELKIPPLIVTSFFAFIMFIVATVLVDFTFNFYLKVETSIIFLIAGLVFMFAGVMCFKKHKTTVDPRKPESSSSLVQTGIYKYTRNPMYVGMLLLLIAFAIYLANPINVLFLISFVLYLNKFQIKPEEKYLSKLFGKNFDTYQANIKRWL